MELISSLSSNKADDDESHTVRALGLSLLNARRFSPNGQCAAGSDARHCQYALIETLIKTFNGVFRTGISG
ncbi:uncharacterized protein PHALS_00282 [Plasmopara halstedii]|uniref:Uncharacterized protein n=1 Tax=Plasmopara halstedii TaxID=4781 RepID=A0A0P1A6B4_PLAHL|nr:uncharacterized protein PHALS_00282 [Plasmopara halstedii]CEG35959.1 hypothetical protein PHALS_00282 [Plasmopara halstedii]|eukprot:XP_024572328.1 hypothetical protein PHALS_00282 [Plasmopara halstedii]